ncbi:MAG TPA: MFS transporter [Allosphingosinicella sp.]|jgi:MFS family permease
MNGGENPHLQVTVLLAAAAYAFTSTFTVVFAYHLRRSGADALFIGAFVAVSLLPFLALSTRIGDHVSRVGRLGLVSASGVLLFMLAQVVMAAVGPNARGALLGLRALQGFGHLVAITPMFAYVSRSVPPARRAAGFGKLSVAFQFGAAVGAACGARILSSEAGTFLLIGLAGAALSVPLLIPLSAEPSAAVTADRARAPRAVHRIVPWSLSVPFALAAASFGVLAQFSPAWASTLSTRNEATGAAALLPAALFGSAAGRLLVGRLHLNPRFNLLTLATAALAVPAVTAAGNALTVLALPALGLVAGLGYGLAMPRLTSDAVQMGEEAEHGRIIAGMVALSEVGYRGSPLLLAALVQREGYALGFAIAPGLMMIWLLAASGGAGKGGDAGALKGKQAG